MQEDPSHKRNAQPPNAPPRPHKNNKQALPDSLADAVADAAAATAEAIARGATRCQVEILLPEFWDPISGPIFPNKGDQERFWRMTRRFIEALAAATGAEGVKAVRFIGGWFWWVRGFACCAQLACPAALCVPPNTNTNTNTTQTQNLKSIQQPKKVYPDAGVAAMLSYQWQDRSFAIDSLNSRRPIAPGDGLAVVACPDPPGAEECLKAVRQAGEQDEADGVPERPVVLFNQRLSRRAGAVVVFGLGLSVFLCVFVI
jgi:hypothetical protein